jgi:hypothetical protein
MGTVRTVTRTQCHQLCFAPIRSNPLFDRARARMLSLSGLGRGAEAISSRAAVPRIFGGPSERCKAISSAEAADGSPAAGGWGAWLIPAHCHPESWGGALSRSAASCVFARLAPFPARHSIPRITIDRDFSRTGFSLSGSDARHSARAPIGPGLMELAKPKRAEACSTRRQTYAPI